MVQILQKKIDSMLGNEIRIFVRKNVSKPCHVKVWETTRRFLQIVKMQKLEF